MNRPLYEKVRGQLATLDEKSVSDEARWWADDETKWTPPEMNVETRGAWRASLEIAFEAGRLLARLEARGGA